MWEKAQSLKVFATKSVPWLIWASAYPLVMKWSSPFWKQGSGMLCHVPPLRYVEHSETTAYGRWLPGHTHSISFIFTGPTQRIHRPPQPEHCQRCSGQSSTEHRWNQTTFTPNDASKRVSLHLLHTSFSATYLLVFPQFLKTSGLQVKKKKNLTAGAYHREAGNEKDIQGWC